MADADDFKIKGAASASAEEDVGEVAASRNAVGVTKHDQPILDGSDAPEAGEIDSEADEDAVATEKAQDETKAQTREQQLEQYRWCKCLCDPVQFGQSQYFLHMDTQVSQWEEPNEPYWIWDAAKQDVDDSGLHYPAIAPNPTASVEPDPNYQGYNPKIHGNYDPNADYAQYHHQRRAEESGIIDQGPPGVAVPRADPSAYTTAGTFNRFTGAFQDATHTADHHSDANKSARQMGAFFDVDAAANAHDGRSLKEERRNEKLSKKQIKELAEKRRMKKEKKRMDFYKT